MATQPLRFADIVPKDGNFSVLARVVRLSCVPDQVRGRGFLNIEMVLMDSAGDRIGAFLKQTLIYRFRQELKEGDVYRISSFSVGSNIGPYRSTSHSYEINFTLSTVLLRAPVVAVPPLIHRFTDPRQIFDSSFDTNYLVDVMGILTGTSSEKLIEKDGRSTKLRVIELDNNGYKFKITLFGNYVDDLNEYLARGDVDNAVVVVLFAKAKPFNGQNVLQNSIYSSKVFSDSNLQKLLS